MVKLTLFQVGKKAMFLKLFQLLVYDFDMWLAKIICVN